MNINTQEKTYVKYFLIFLGCNWYFQLLRTRPVIEQRIHSTSLNASIRDKKLDRVTDNLYRAFSTCRSQNNLNRDERKNVSYTVRKGRTTASYRAIFVNFQIPRWTVLHFCSRVREQVQNHQSSTFYRTATTKTPTMKIIARFNGNHCCPYQKWIQVKRYFPIGNVSFGK